MVPPATIGKPPELEIPKRVAGREELKLDVFKHSGSVSDDSQVVTWQVVRVFGYYATENQRRHKENPEFFSHEYAPSM